MKRVYVVTIGAYSERRVAGIFGTKEKAETTAAELENAQEEKERKEPVFIHEYPFDETLGQLYSFTLESVDGKWREIDRDELREEFYDFAIKDRWGHYDVNARSFEEAVERAKKLEAEEAIKGD